MNLLHVQAKHIRSQALAINENNYKALFRKAKGLGETGYFEKAEKILDDLLKKNESGECRCNHPPVRPYIN